MRLARPQRITLVAIGSLLAAFGAGLAVARPWMLCVEFTNGSRAPLRDLRVEVTGDDARVSQLAMGERWTCKVAPRSESDVVVSWLDANGAQRSEQLNVYIEHGYGGDIACRLDDADRLACNAHVVPLWWWPGATN